MKKRILSILLTLCMVLCLMPTAAFAEDNEDTPAQALANVDITFPKPEEGKKIGDGSAASASDLTFLDFGPALWQQGSEPKKLKAEDTYEKDNIYLLYFAFYTQKPITDETALTFNGNPITRYADDQALTEALNAYDGKEDAYLGFVMFSKDGTGDPSMGDLKNIYVVGLYAIIRAQEAQTPEDTVKEQFNLDPDGTYYFDLFGENIPGTVNDALPDNTMHYVPFTYAGTVDAYKLTSAMATTEEYAKNNKYPHSLFVADYAVTKDVSRDALNTAKLIFGKNYASGGVDYTLRAPSVGSGSTGSGESRRVTPQNNEWDKMLDKDDKYIKNWGKMFSWGQDTWSTSAPRCAVRGYDSARYGDHHSSWYNYVGLGFRPVLEVLNPDTLDSDGLKAVTLALGGGKLGNRSEDIQIIVKNGESFTAPASDGLTRPDGNNEDYFMWLGSDGNLYAPGDRVPADVTKLMALFYEQFNLALGGRYYFDLSAMGIPGTVNDALPDSTLHYVPFTYAGTVDAYSLKNEVDTDTTSYKHSLFVADYAVTHTVSWDNLNTANLIFGKDYAATAATAAGKLRRQLGYIRRDAFAGRVKGSVTAKPLKVIFGISVRAGQTIGRRRGKLAVIFHNDLNILGAVTQLAAAKVKGNGFQSVSVQCVWVQDFKDGAETEAQVEIRRNVVVPVAGRRVPTDRPERHPSIFRSVLSQRIPLDPVFDISVVLVQ